jgi:hypothetical protein
LKIYSNNLIQCIEFERKNKINTRTTLHPLYTCLTQWEKTQKWIIDCSGALKEIKKEHYETLYGNSIKNDET